MIRFFKKNVFTFGPILTASVLLLSAPVEASAQIDLGDAFSKALAEALTKGAEAVAKRKVNVTPLVNTINDSTKEIILELEHQSDEKITAKLTIGNNPSGGVPVQNTAQSTDSVKKKPSLLDEEENKKDTSSITYKPMASWITGLPKSVTIAPGEKKKIVLKVKIPADAVAGEYAAWIATDVAPAENSTYKTPSVSVTKLVLKK